jgi:hypothetical protein
MGAVPLHQQTTVGYTPVSERRQAVLLGTELRGLARMSEALDPSLVIFLANEFFAFAADAVACALIGVVAYQVTHLRLAAERCHACLDTAVIDVSPLFKYRVSGKDATRLVDRIVTRDVPKMAVGQVSYTHWCDGDGKVIDDGTVSRLGPELYRWTAAEPNLRFFLNTTIFKATRDGADRVRSVEGVQLRSEKVIEFTG